MSYSKNPSALAGHEIPFPTAKPTAYLRQTYGTAAFCYLYCTSHILEYLVWGILALMYDNKCL